MRGDCSGILRVGVLSQVGSNSWHMDEGCFILVFLLSLVWRMVTFQLPDFCCE